MKRSKDQYADMHYTFVTWHEIKIKPGNCVRLPVNSRHAHRAQAKSKVTVFAAIHCIPNERKDQAIVIQ